MANHLWEVLVVRRSDGRTVVGPIPCWTEGEAAEDMADLERKFGGHAFDVCCQRAAAEPPACCGDELPAYSGDPDGVDLSA